MIHEISDCKINTWQTVMYPTHNSMRCIQAFPVKQSYQMNIGIPQSITRLITCRLHQQSSILCTCGASWLHWRWWHRQNQTSEHADCWFPAPVWFSGYRPSPPTHHRQVELPSLTTTLPCQSPVYMSTHGKYLHIKKLTCKHKKWIQGVVMEHTTKTGLYLWLFKVTLILMRERLT